MAVWHWNRCIPAVTRVCARSLPTIKCTWSSVDDLSKSVLAPGEIACGQSCLDPRRARIRRQFNIGEVEGSFDSTSLGGASWSTAKPDRDLIGVNNGGKGLSQTSDDGHLNRVGRRSRRFSWVSMT